MKYCNYCGSQVPESAAFCGRCGARVAAPSTVPDVAPAVRRDDTTATLIKVFLILGCIAFGCALIPLCWCIPITVSIFRKLNNGEAIGTGLKVCTLFFVSLIAGILLLCDNNL